MNDDDKQVFDRKTVNDRINKQVTFISKDNRLIYPELRVNQRIVLESKGKSTGDKPAPKKVFSDIDLQTWYYNKVKQRSFAYFSYEYSRFLGWLYLQ